VAGVGRHRRWAADRLANRARHGPDPTGDLAAHGFVAFARNPNHQRAKLVDLTDEGREALDEIGRRQAAWANRIAAALDPATLDAAATVLRALRGELEADRPDVN